VFSYSQCYRMESIENVEHPTGHQELMAIESSHGEERVEHASSAE
jgi:hypothetical protein